MDQEQWERLEADEIPGCKVFVRPTSYLLMDPEERERKFAEDAEAGRYPACLWIEAMRHRSIG